MIMKNSFWFAFGTTVTKLMRAVILIYVARALGANQYGIFTYALSLVGIFMIFADLGLTNILTRELSKESNEKNSYLSTAFIIKIGFLAFAILLSGIFGPIISKFDQAGPLVILIAVFVALESMRSFLYSITRAQNKMQTEAGIGIVTEFISVGIILFMFLHNPSVKSLIDAFIIGNLVGVIITLLFLKSNFEGIFKYFKKDLVQPIIHSSWPFAVMGVFGIFMTNIDSVMIALWNDPSVLGLYSAAQKPISLLYVLPGFLSISLFPLISKLVSENKGNLRNVIEKSYRISLSLALPIIIGGIILAGPLLTVTFGDEYIGAMLTFQILLLTLIPAFPGAVFADVIVAEDRQRIFIISSAIGGAVNVLLNFILIPTYGIAGSAVATLVALITTNGILYLRIRKSHHINIFTGLGKIIISSLVIIPIAYLLKNSFVPLIVVVPSCAIGYVLMLIALKAEIITDIKQSLEAR